MILIGDVNKPVMNTILFARLLGGETVVVHMEINSSDKGRIEERWKDLGVDVHLVVIFSFKSVCINYPVSSSTSLAGFSRSLWADLLFGVR